MKNYYLFLIFISISVLLLTVNVLACEPCPSTLNLQETINNSDLIIIGQKISDIGNDTFSGRAKGMRVKVIEILKGNGGKEEINIVYLHGRCGYGIYFSDNEEYVLFLKESDAENYDYDAVNWGCSVKGLVVEDNQVEYKGQKISIEELTQNINVKKTDNQINNLYWILPLILIIIFIVFFVYKKKR